MYVVLVLVNLLLVCGGISGADPPCGGLFTAEEFVVESPNYPEKRRDNISCEYVFRNENCHTHFIFTFLNFTLDCEEAGLKVDSHQVLCGKQDKPKMYHSPNGLLTVKFWDTHGNGSFKIHVSRSECHNSEKVKIASNIVLTQIIEPVSQPHRVHSGAEFYEREFVMYSPDHPKSGSVDSKYYIYRAHPNICTLRFDFCYYSNGERTKAGCEEGFLEIDEISVCGVASGSTLISDFDPNSDGPKMIRYKSKGYPSGSHNGFAIQVTQLECFRSFSSSSKIRSNVFCDDNSEQGCPGGERLENSEDHPKSQNWTFTDFNSHKDSDKIYDDPNCLILRNQSGSFIANTTCYKIIKHAGFCSVHMNCGAREWIVEFGDRRFLEFKFSNGDKIVGNFSVRYSQYLCRSNPIHPVCSEIAVTAPQITCDPCPYCSQPLPIYPNIPVTTAPDSQVRAEDGIPKECNKEYRQDRFTMDFYGNENDICTLTIYKSNAENCCVNITFVEFNLPCNEEYLLIQNQTYCGEKKGSTDVLRFNGGDSIMIIYYRAESWKPSGLRFLIHAKQIVQQYLY